MIRAEAFSPPAPAIDVVDLVASRDTIAVTIADLHNQARAAGEHELGEDLYAIARHLLLPVRGAS